MAQKKRRLAPQTDMYKRDGLSEGRHQIILFEWADLMAKTGKYPHLRWLYHVPNGGARDIVTASNLKRQGVKAGVSDLCLPVRRGVFCGLYIELKAGKKKPTGLQLEFGEFVTGQGYLFVVCYGWDSARQQLEDYLNIESL